MKFQYLWISGLAFVPETKMSEMYENENVAQDIPRGQR
jgi:hypothetical protein